MTSPAKLAFALCLLGLVGHSAPAAADTGAPAAHTVERIDQGPAPITFVVGEGPPQSTVIFMHGMGSTPEHNNNLIRTLLAPPDGGPAVRVVAVWMRPDTGLHTMSGQLARARAAIEAESGPVILMGHSFGAKAAVKLAAEYPKSKVTSVVALAPQVGMLQRYWTRLTNEQTMPSREVVARRIAHEQQVLTERLTIARARNDESEVASASGALSYAEIMADLVHHDEPGIEHNVTRPTLVLHGTRDVYVGIDHARHFAAANRDAVQLVELPDADHNFKHPHLARQDLATTMMREPVQAFLAQQRRRSVTRMTDDQRPHSPGIGDRVTPRAPALGGGAAYGKGPTVRVGR